MSDSDGTPLSGSWACARARIIPPYGTSGRHLRVLPDPVECVPVEIVRTAVTLIVRSMVVSAQSAGLQRPVFLQQAVATGDAAAKPALASRSTSGVTRCMRLGGTKGPNLTALTPGRARCGSTPMQMMAFPRRRRSRPSCGRRPGPAEDHIGRRGCKSVSVNYARPSCGRPRDRPESPGGQTLV